MTRDEAIALQDGCRPCTANITDTLDQAWSERTDRGIARKAQQHVTRATSNRRTRPEVAEVNAHLAAYWTAHADFYCNRDIERLALATREHCTHRGMA